MEISNSYIPHSLNILCPLCNSLNEPVQVEMEYRHFVDESHSMAVTTHAWVCPRCPAILFEYYDPDNIMGLKQIIKE